MRVFWSGALLRIRRPRPHRRQPHRRRGGDGQRDPPPRHGQPGRTYQHQGLLRHRLHVRRQELRHRARRQLRVSFERPAQLYRERQDRLLLKGLERQVWLRDQALHRRVADVQRRKRRSSRDERVPLRQCEQQGRLLDRDRFVWHAYGCARADPGREAGRELHAARQRRDGRAACCQAGRRRGSEDYGRSRMGQPGRGLRIRLADLYQHPRRGILRARFRRVGTGRLGEDLHARQGHARRQTRQHHDRCCDSCLRHGGKARQDRGRDDEGRGRYRQEGDLRGHAQEVAAGR